MHGHADASEFVPADDYACIGMDIRRRYLPWSHPVSALIFVKDGQIAEYLQLVDIELAAAERHRTASSGARLSAVRGAFHPL